MRIPIDWLKEFVEIADDEIETAADALTMAGLEVEETLESALGTVWFTKITPNRGDWASVFGTARELAAVYPEKTLRPLQLPLPERGTSVPHPEDTRGLGGEVSVRIEDAANCPRFHAIIVRGVTIGETPDWMQARLSAALGDEYRSINNVADITNYVMLETGQPLHAFDLATIPGGEILVRQARPGEKLVTLDDVDWTLPNGALCICDREKPISLAGIMGGRDTEITAQTVDVLIETAHFDPFCIRRTAKKTLRSGASYRFERYVDPNLVPVAGYRAAQLIVQICGGAIVGAVDSVAQATPKRRVLARMDRIRKLLGVDVDRDAAIAALERLGLSVERSAGALDCGIPSWRPDLTIEDDIAEEVGRIALGYANIPEKLSPPPGTLATDSPRASGIGHLKSILAGCGLQEVVTHSLVGPGPFTERSPETLALRNPLRPEYGQLRSALLPNLFGIASRANRDGLRDLALFEVGSVYIRAGDAVREPLRVAGLVAGSALPNAWGVKGDVCPADFFFARGIVEEFLHALGIAATFAAGSHPWLHPYRTASILVDGEPIGVIGEFSANTIAAADLPKRACGFDLDGDALLRLAKPIAARFDVLPEFPAVIRDLAPMFSLDVPFAAIQQAAVAAAGPTLEALRLADVFEDPRLGEGRRALTLRFTFRKEEGTLRSEEVESALDGVRAALTALGGEWRG